MYSRTAEIGRAATERAEVRARPEPDALDTVIHMAPNEATQGPGHARYTYRLRVSSTAVKALRAEWDRCRWVRNQCVAESRVAHKTGQKKALAAASLDYTRRGFRLNDGRLHLAGGICLRVVWSRDLGRFHPCWCRLRKT
jgi:hypothetical protein